MSKDKWVPRTEYGRKLQDPRWQRKRLEILERDEWMCKVCYDSASTLHVHHRWYVPNREPWDYPAKALVTVCESCHEHESDVMRGMTDDLVLMLKQAGAMSSQIEYLLHNLAPAAGSDKLIHDYAWDVISFALGRLIADFLADDGNDGPYDRALIEYQEHCSKNALKDGDEDDGSSS